MKRNMYLAILTDVMRTPEVALQYQFFESNAGNEYEIYNNYTNEDLADLLDFHLDKGETIELLKVKTSYQLDVAKK